MRTVVASFFFLLLIISTALSQTPVRESFEYPATIAGLGSAINGFGGPWAIDASAAGVEGCAIIAGNRFNYADLSWVIPDTGNHLQIYKKTAWSESQRYKRPLAAAWPNDSGKSYWISYLIDVEDTLPVGNTYFMVKLYNGSNECLAIGKGGGATTPYWTCGSGWPGAAGDDVSAVEIVKGPVWLVVRVDMNGGTGSDFRTYMWIDPNPAGGDPDTSLAAVKRNSGFPNGFDNIAVEFGGDGEHVQLFIDEIHIDSSFVNLTSGTTAVRESFEYPATIDGLGSAVNGFGGPWAIDTSAHGLEGQAIIAGNRFNYDNLSWAIPDTGNHLQVFKKNAWSDAQRYKRPLAASWPNVAGQSYWISYLIDVKEPLPVGNSYFMVKLYEGTNERLAIGKGGGASTPLWTCGSGWPGAAGDDVSAVDIVAGPVWLVVRVDMNGGSGTDFRTYMWIDPNPEGVDPDTSVAAVKRNSTFPNGFDNIALEFGGDGVDVQLIFDEICIATTFTGLVTDVPSTGDGMPGKFALSQNYPNPFNPSTKFSYTLDRSGQVHLSVFDLLGREVAVLVNGLQSVGEHSVTFQGNDLPSGVYFYRLQSGQDVVTKKMMLMK